MPSQSKDEATHGGFLAVAQTVTIFIEIKEQVIKIDVWHLCRHQSPLN